MTLLVGHKIKSILDMMSCSILYLHFKQSKLKLYDIYLINT